ncbi:MAG: peptidoglycan-binding protein, partial [Proteobacteria bacterium]|nr:peptidoglycan-binding protein [Pseudomonadota bacterium]
AAAEKARIEEEAAAARKLAEEKAAEVERLKAEAAKAAADAEAKAAEAARLAEEAEKRAEEAAAAERAAQENDTATAARENEAQGADRKDRGLAVEQADDAAKREEETFQKAVLDGSEKAFRAYLDEYPDGRFVADARERLSALSNTARQEAKPRTDSETAIVETERKAEQPIVDRREAYMERSTRAQAQRWLSMLGFNTYGVDGVFGSRTRSAIAAWQGSSGYRADGYLSRQQYRALRQAAQYAEARQNRQRRYQQDYDVLEGPVDGYYERYYRDDGYYNDGGGLVIIPGY